MKIQTGNKEIFEDSIINGEKHDKKVIEEKAGKVEKCEDAAVVIREFEDIIKTDKKYYLDSIPAE